MSLQTTTSIDVAELLQMAREDLVRNRLTSAEKTLEQAILLNNQVADAFHLLGYVYSKKGKFKKAIVVLERALTLDPLHTEAAIALSSLYNDMGRYKEGAAIFNKTKTRLSSVAPGHDPRINQNLAIKHAEIGMVYLQYERYKEAHEEFSKALQLEPGSTDYTIQRSKCLAKLGEEDKAIELLTKLLETQPTSVEAKLQLGILYHTKNKLNEALREWQQALTLSPENKSVQMYIQMITT